MKQLAPVLQIESIPVFKMNDFEELCVAGTMLIKTRLGDVQKFVRLTEPNLKEFLIAGKILVLIKLYTGSYEVLVVLLHTLLMFFQK